MLFDHERLDVYQRALEVLGLCDLIVLNMAEGAGEFSAREKSRFYRMARRSATEAAAVLHIVRQRRQASEERLQAGRELLLRVVSMLVRMNRVARAR